MKSEKRKKQIFQAALEIVEQGGVAELNARKVADKSQCALGSIYTAFESLEDLQLHINAAILARLYDLLHKAAEEGIAAGKSIKELFVDLGLAYVAFGTDQTSLWKVLFEHSNVSNFPEWYLTRAKEGIYRLAVRIAPAYGITEKECKRLIGFFWASIHGLLEIMLSHKMKMVAELFEEDYLQQYIQYSVTGLFSGGLYTGVHRT